MWGGIVQNSYFLSVLTTLILILLTAGQIFMAFMPPVKQKNRKWIEKEQNDISDIFFFMLV